MVGFGCLFSGNMPLITSDPFQPTLQEPPPPPPTPPTHTTPTTSSIRTHLRDGRLRLLVLREHVLFPKETYQARERDGRETRGGESVAGEGRPVEALALAHDEFLVWVQHNT